MSTARTLTPEDLMREALARIEQLQARVKEYESGASEPVAIVGLSCRFPGARGPEEYWRLLSAGVDAITEIPASRWDIDACYDPVPETPGKIYTRFGGFLDGIEEFDSTFFGMSPREAISLDPQQRLLLEACWEALELAGIAPDSLRGAAGGVFVGIGGVDYYQRLSSRPPEDIDAYMASGNAHSTAAGRLSYVLGLHGPSIAIDTACSSSLVAVHAACQSLRRRECTIALTGGVSAILSPTIHVGHCRSRMLAADGRCKVFDAAADGFIRSEGVGMVVLKRRSDAQRDGDRILALIRGSAVNQDGRTTALTVPNGKAQQAVIRQALADARLQPAQISYVEAHGTGTSLGDPIEMAALAQVFGERAEPLSIGSVKANIGHAEAAAGIAGLIKVVLAMQHREIPPQLHFNVPNPRIEWDAIPLRVVRERTPWGTPDAPVFGGVSSFGFGGTNAHVVLEAPVEAPAQERALEAGQGLLVLSAKTPSALLSVAANYRKVLLDTRDDVSLARVLSTASQGRAHLPARAAVSADRASDAAAGLEAIISGHPAAGSWRGDAVPDFDGRIAFIYPGQGSLRSGMGRELYHSSAVFRAAIDRCAATLDAALPHPLPEILFGTGTQPLLDRTEHAQPAVFAIEYALTMFWKSAGIQPNAVVGHSVGEFAAACAAGVLSVEDACALVLARGRLMQSIDGRMAAIGAAESDVVPIVACHPEVEIGAVNGRNQVVITGPELAVEAAAADAARAGLKTAILPGSVAFHSRAMNVMQARWGEVLAPIACATPCCDWVSTLTGCEVADDTRWVEYWQQQARRPVRFAAAADRLWALGYRVLIEVGPSAGLAILAAEAAETAPAAGLWLAGLRHGRGEWDVLRDRVAQLYVSGLNVDWSGWDPARRLRVALPTYPFERTRYWVDAVEPRSHADVEPAFSYAVKWEPRNEPRGQTRGTWVVYGEPTDATHEIAHALRHDGGADVVLAADAAALEGVLDRAGDGALAGVVHIDGISCTFDDNASAEAIEGAVLDRCTKFVQTLRALAMREGRTRLWVVTRGAVHVAERSCVVAPDMAVLWGLGRVVALEHPEVWGGLIDLEPHASGAAGVEQILWSGDEDQLVLRGGHVYVPRLDRIETRTGRATLRGDGTYLVTGGLGALGVQIAQRLIDCGARHLIVVARSAPSPNVSARIDRWRTSGVDVQVEQADVCDRAAMTRVLTRTSMSAAPLRGVVHAAGVNAVHPVVDLDRATMRPVFAAKVAGAWLLHELTRDVSLDFFVCFSSIASVWGSKGQGHYAAANAFLDALVSYRQRSGLPARVVNWGAWGAGGMATSTARDWLRRVGINPLSPRAALERFESGLSAPGQEIVANVDWPRFLELYEARRRHPLFTRVTRENASGATRAPSEGSPAHGESELQRPELADTIRAQGPHEGRRSLTLVVREHVAGVLGLGSEEGPAPHQGFFSIGFDSLMALELKNRLATALRVRLPSTLAFDYPSIRDVVEYLANDVLRLGASASQQRATTHSRAPVVTPVPDDIDASVEATLARFERIIGKA